MIQNQVICVGVVRCYVELLLAVGIRCHIHLFVNRSKKKT